MICVLGSGMAAYILCEKIRAFDKDTPITVVSIQDGRYYTKPQLSVGWSKGKTADAITLASPDDITERLNIKVMTKVTVLSIDTAAKTVHTSAGELAYTQCVYALGSDAIKLPIEKPQGVQVLNNLDDYDAFLDFLSDWSGTEKPRVGIIGCGLIGFELISTLNEMGCKVSAAHDRSCMLNQLLPAKAQEYVTEVVAKHCDYYPGFLTTKINQDKDGYVIDSLKQSFRADYVIESIGVRGNTMVAEKSGLSVDKLGVCVDEDGQCTGTKDVWGLGDCISLHGKSRKYVGHIRQMADVIAYNLTHKDRKFLVSKPMPYNVKSALCPVSVMGDFDEKLDWQWEKNDLGLIGRQYENGVMNAWCVIGDQPEARSELMRALR